MLFNGFDYFVESLIATLIMLAPMIAVLVPAYLGLVVSMLVAMPDKVRNNPPDPETVFVMLGAFALFFLVVLVVSIIIHVAFIFIYPLIVDRDLSGLEAVKTSFRAAMANLGGVVGLTL